LRGSIIRVIRGECPVVPDVGGVAVGAIKGILPESLTAIRPRSRASLRLPTPRAEQLAALFRGISPKEFHE
jgi:hypothetical protein